MSPPPPYGEGWQTGEVGVRRKIRVTALIGCVVFLLGCSFPNKIPKAFQESLMEHCLEEGGGTAFCGAVVAEALFQVNELNYDYECVLDGAYFYLKTGVAMDPSRRCDRVP